MRNDKGNISDFFGSVFGLVIVAFALAMTGCANISGNVDKSVFSASEAELNTGGPAQEIFHALVYFPQEYVLQYPGIVVGVEKSKEPRVKRGAVPGAIDASAVFVRGDDRANDFLRARLLGDPKTLGESKVMFISHAVRTAPQGEQEKRHPCFLYNVYRPETGPDRADIDGGASCYDSEPDIEDYFSGSWQAIQRVKQTLKHDLESGNYTHLVVIVMGWNTRQTESIQNFNSLLRRLEKTTLEGLNGASKSFKPYVVGVTWPSEWSTDLIGTFVRGVSLPDKANDADELGSGWLGALINHAVRPAIGEMALARPSTPVPKLLVIGHSFGARATSHAVCRGSLLRSPQGLKAGRDVLEKGQVDWLVGLQGAYSLNRFGGSGAGLIDLRYDSDCEGARRLIFTASSHDGAANSGGFQTTLLGRDANYAGTLSTFNNVVSGALSVPKFATYRATFEPGQDAGSGKVVPVGSNDGGRRKFIYVDASDVIYFNSYGTGAGAHSDIYRSATARVLWRLMESGETR